MGKPIVVRDAPGLKWKQYAGDRWEARWRARHDIVEQGFPIKSFRIWVGTEPTEDEWNLIADTCVSLQQEMLVFANGGPPTLASLDGTLGSLMRCYRTDPDSQYRKIRYNSRCYYDSLMSLIERGYGTEVLADIKARNLMRWHEGWTEGGKTAIGHGKIGMLRTLFSFGATILEDAECMRLSAMLSKMRLAMPKPRTERLTSTQAIAIRVAAHAKGLHSIALAQAIQFELMLRQKDVIGEWVPMAEPGISEVKSGRKFKWLRGIRWEEIDANMTLTHVTSKRQKEISVSLKNAPMVMEELALLGQMPAKGPIVVQETDGLPWDAVEFRRQWRKLANEIGIPISVRNMDSRAGAISEATDAGADLEHVRHAATHSNISMTQRYSRGAEEKIASVQIARVEFRKRPKNET